MYGWSDVEKGQAAIDESGSADLEWINHTFKFNTDLSKAEPPLHRKCYIFKVPEVLRRQKLEAFVPHTVSIGPIHRGQEKFQLMEKVKEWYLRDFLSRLTGWSRDRFTECMKELEKQARGCYSDPCNLDQDNFIQMLMLDGCFLIELFQKALDHQKKDENDPIFKASCMIQYLYHDLLLLENQLPWFVLEFFYKKLIEPSPAEPLSKVVIDFFKNLVTDRSILSYEPDSNRDREILHIVDLLRTSFVQEHKVAIDRLDPAKPTPYISKWTSYTAASLAEAGVEFRKPEKSEAGCMLNITFKDGVFTIPPLHVDERTDPLFRNFMAYEQCFLICNHKVTSYAVLMDNLIDTTKDVDLLCEKGIIANWFSTEDASKFFNGLYKDTRVIDFAYKELYSKVNAHLDGHWKRIKWIRWKKKLRRDYFDTPWSTISFFAAFVLLVLTFLQTIYTIQQ